jgi:hypothetical protein
MPGFWRGVAKAMLDQQALRDADARQAAYDAGTLRPGFLADILAGRRANRAADQYWQDNQVINNASTPLSHLGLDVGHGPNCGCRFCDPYGEKGP